MHDLMVKIWKLVVRFFQWAWEIDADTVLGAVLGTILIILLVAVGLACITGLIILLRATFVISGWYMFAFIFAFPVVTLICVWVARGIHTVYEDYYINW